MSVNGEHGGGDPSGELGNGEPETGEPETGEPQTGEPRPFLARLRPQVELILEGGVPEAEAYPPEWASEGLQYLARRGHCLVRDRDLERVRPILDPNHGGEVVTGDANVNGLTLFQWPAGQWASVEAACQAVDRELGRGVISPDHLLWMVSASSTCPATEPEPVRDGAYPLPEPTRRGDDGAGVLVSILDSGLFPDLGDYPWLAGVRGECEDPYRSGSDHEILPYAGHGTFSAGVLRTVAPAADVFVAKTFRKVGTVFESDLVGDVGRALGTGADILSLAFGTYSRQQIPLLGIDVVEQAMRDYKGVVLVAAAGNDQGREPFFPAASPATVSVGALDVAWRRRAWFSNYGGWVDVYAPGEDLVNAYPKGTFFCVEPPNEGQKRIFSGLARWSGTSFSTPLVAGLIAARMSMTGENGRQAADALLARARERAVPGLGAVLLPGEVYW
jgi:subtilisin family serine protease